MKFVLLACLLTTGIALAHDPLPPAPRKKGIGLAESRGMGAREFSALKVDWYYNWSSHSNMQIGSKFVPMAFSPQRVADMPAYARSMLGFHEPDNAHQANVSPEAGQVQVGPFIR